jgi:hypothetical protein
MAYATVTPAIPHWRPMTKLKIVGGVTQRDQIIMEPVRRVTV